MEMLSQVPQPGVNSMGPALYFPQQATFHPLNYLIGLSEAFQHLGGKIARRCLGTGCGRLPGSDDQLR